MQIRRLSTKWSVVLLVALTLSAALLLTGWLAIWLAESERMQLEQAASNQLREAAALVDREVASIRNVLTVLAGSSLLQTGQLEPFYREAHEVSRKIGINIVLRDQQLDRQVVNVALPWGSDLADGIPAPRTETDWKALRAGEPFVSNVFFGLLMKSNLVAVIVPVLQEGKKLRYTLAAGVPLSRFAELLSSLNLHPHHLVTVIDSSGVIVARSERNVDFAGTLIATSLPLDITNTGRSKNREGIPFHWFNGKSELTGWYISVGVADAVFEAPRKRAIATFGTAASVIFGLAMVFAFRWGGRLAQTSGALGIDREPTRAEFEVLFDAAPNGVIVIGADGVILLVNQYIEARFGYTKAELLGQPVEVLVPGHWHVGHRKIGRIYLNDPAARPMGSRGELSARRKDGSEFPIEITLNSIFNGGLVLVTMIDITARKSAGDRLSAAIAERDDLRRRLMQAQESERLHLAQELHDETGQGLTSVMLKLKEIEKGLEPLARDALRSVRTDMEVIGATLHRVAWELRPLSIDELGLKIALENYVSEWSSRSGIAADFYCGGCQLDKLTDEICTTIYRIVQEALTNIARHAKGATAVSVVIESIGSVLRLTVDDDGPGFDPSSIQREAGAGGLGLPGMRERLALVGGDLEIETALALGTSIIATIPLEKKGMLA